MISKYRHFIKSVALLTVLCVVQIYVFAGPSGSIASAGTVVAPSQQLSGTIRTVGNKPVIVNGNNVRSGTTILSGSTIETAEGVGATVQLGCSALDISPNTELTVEFTGDGNVKVNLKRGCAILRTCGNSSGTIITPDGTSTETGARKQADVCFPLGALTPIVNQGAAANAGAGTGTVAAGQGGINRTVLGLLLAGGGATVIALLLAGRGENPSPSNP